MEQQKFDGETHTNRCLIIVSKLISILISYFKFDEKFINETMMMLNGQVEYVTFEYFNLSIELRKQKQEIDKRTS